MLWGLQENRKRIVQERVCSRSLDRFLTYSKNLGDGPNTVSESTASNTELSEFLGPLRVPGREFSEFLSA